MTQEDARFCVEMLPRVSRTFALSIEALPPGLRDPVRVSYLLCRVVDTVEDAAGLPWPTRSALFEAFDDCLLDDGADPAGFEERALALGEGGADEALCRGAGAVFRSFRALPATDREAVRPHILDLSLGMRMYAARAARLGRFRLRDLEDLERYCYYVAGTVGELLTPLFAGYVPGLEAKAALEARAASFGLGLQLVNIVKDVAEDLERGVLFLPEALLAAHGAPADERLLDPAFREAGLGAIRQVAARARLHLERAREYTLLWPIPEGSEVVRFCAVPLLLALGTLAEVESGPDTLQRGRNPRVSREAVARILNAAGRAAEDPQALRGLLQRP
ncbi:MAG: squalene/phytoene synthase family protein [Deltaproteobacteria bacterium]|nr:squalene/phytoene synthase family protein [Deltaproteobacteria bacterium]